MASKSKHVPANLFQSPEEFCCSRYMAVLPPEITFEDLLQPNCWAHFGGQPPTREYPLGQGQFKIHDIVRCVAEDGSFDLDLVVADVNVGSVTMKVRPYFGDAAGEAAVALAARVAGQRPNEVPLNAAGKPKVYIEHLAATKWRVVGLEGEVSQGHATKASAQKAMDEYLAKAGLVMPALKADEKAA